MIQSTIIRVCIISLLMGILTAQRQNCGGKFPPCPDGQICAPPGRGIFGVKGQHKCYDCPCSQSSQCYFDSDGDIKCDCGPNFTGEYCETSVADCGPLPDFGLHVNTSNYDNTTTISGYSFTYTCTPCTYFVGINVTSSTITCQEDGTWSTPTCVSASDVGYVVNGTPLPSPAIGCGACSGVQKSGFSMLGNLGCSCNFGCCDQQTCCFDWDCV